MAACCLDQVHNTTMMLGTQNGSHFGFGIQGAVRVRPQFGICFLEGLNQCSLLVARYEDEIRRNTDLVWNMLEAIFDALKLER